MTGESAFLIRIPHLLPCIYIHKSPTKYQREKFWTHEIPTKKNLGPRLYTREEILDPRNNHKKKVGTHQVVIL